MPFNPMPDGVCRTIKANYYKVSLACFIRRGGYAATGVVVTDEGSESDSGRSDLAVKSKRHGL